ncbi:MAG: GNAT family N-acetyltransferase [Ruminiclostridium sp.]|nr:GNAT family N-acetyltransferase [Ruminiclostridium sp.]
MGALTRKATENDAEALKELYFNHLTAYPSTEEQDMKTWYEKLRKFAADDNYHIFVLDSEEKIVSSVTLIIIENLTHNLRPYALIENVVTHCDYRGKGFASALMNRATEIAKQRGCYKIMLLTGSKKDSTLNFYHNNGFNSEDKTGFIKWL